jgi:hypothetical protein
MLADKHPSWFALPRWIRADGTVHGTSAVELPAADTDNIAPVTTKTTTTATAAATTTTVLERISRTVLVALAQRDITAAGAALNRCAALGGAARAMRGVWTCARAAAQLDAACRRWPAAHPSTGADDAVAVAVATAACDLAAASEEYLERFADRAWAQTVTPWVHRCAAAADVAAVAVVAAAAAAAAAAGHGGGDADSVAICIARADASLARAAATAAATAARLWSETRAAVRCAAGRRSGAGPNGLASDLNLAALAQLAATSFPSAAEVSCVAADTRAVTAAIELPPSDPENPLATAPRVGGTVAARVVVSGLGSGGSNGPAPDFDRLALIVAPCDATLGDPVRVPLPRPSASATTADQGCVRSRDIFCFCFCFFVFVCCC